MVPAESLSSGSEQMTSELWPSKKLAQGSGLAARAATANRRIRARPGDMDRASCQTQLSQRQFLIQFQGDPANRFRSEPERFRGISTNNQWSIKVVDWD